MNPDNINPPPSPAVPGASPRLPLYEPGGYARRRDLPEVQREPFGRWLELCEVRRPAVGGVALDNAGGQDGFWPADYARWQVEELGAEPAGVDPHAIRTGPATTLRARVLALAPEEVAAFASDQARRTGAANLRPDLGALAMAELTPAALESSAELYLEQFGLWRRWEGLMTGESERPTPAPGVGQDGGAADWEGLAPLSLMDAAEEGWPAEPALAPCPHCGAAGEKNLTVEEVPCPWDDGPDAAPHHQVVCADCAGRGSREASASRARSQWRRQAPAWPTMLPEAVPLPPPRALSCPVCRHWAVHPVRVEVAPHERGRVVVERGEVHTDLPLLPGEESLRGVVVTLTFQCERCLRQGAESYSFHKGATVHRGLPPVPTEAADVADPRPGDHRPLPTLWRS